MATIKDHARNWVQQGYPIVPIRAWGNEPGDWKKPLIFNWTQNPITTDLEIEQFWSQNPDANLALVTGQASGIVVLDFDNKPEEGKNGLEALRDWETMTGKHVPDETWTVVSGGGGSHWYYKYDKPLSGFSCGTFAVDVRADGNCILLPPSKHFSGRRYEWEYSPREFNLLPADDTVLEFIEYLRNCGQSNSNNRNGDIKSCSHYLPLPDAIHQGERTDYMVRLVFSLVSRNLDIETIKTAVAMENNKKCFPPLTLVELEKEVFPAIFRQRKGVSSEWIRQEKLKKLKNLLS